MGKRKGGSKTSLCAPHEKKRAQQSFATSNNAFLTLLLVGFDVITTELVCVTCRSSVGIPNWGEILTLLVILTCCWLVVIFCYFFFFVAPCWWGAERGPVRVVNSSKIGEEH